MTTCGAVFFLNKRKIAVRNLRRFTTDFLKGLMAIRHPCTKNPKQAQALTMFGRELLKFHGQMKPESSNLDSIQLSLFKERKRLCMTPRTSCPLSEMTLCGWVGKLHHFEGMKDRAVYILTFSENLCPLARALQICHGYASTNKGAAWEHYDALSEWSSHQTFSPLKSVKDDALSYQMINSKTPMIWGRSKKGVDDKSLPKSMHLMVNYKNHLTFVVEKQGSLAKEFCYSSKRKWVVTCFRFICSYFVFPCFD